MISHGISTRTYSSRHGLPCDAADTRPRHGIRIIQQNLCLERVLGVALAGSRLEILRVLVVSPMSVTAIASAIFLPFNAVSRELGILEAFGLVWWSREKNSRIYHLSDRLRATREGDMLEIVITADAGCWAVLHLDESADPSKAVAPPDCFIGGG